MEPTVKDVDIVDIADLLDITNAAPHYGAAALSLLANHGCQISAHESAVLGLVKQIGHEDIVLDQTINHPLVVHAFHTLGLRLPHHGDFQIFSDRHKGCGHCPTDSGLHRAVRALKVTLELVII